MEVKDRIREKMLELGADVVGFASVDAFDDAPKGYHPTDLYAECKSVIAVGIALPKGILKSPKKIIYGYFNEKSCQMLDELSFHASKWIEATFCCYAVPVQCDGPYEYWEPEKLRGKGLLSMKHIAVACGLGTIGKNSLLVNKTYGNLLTVGCVLTNLDLPTDPAQETVCIAGCRKCIDSCPQSAISEDGTVNQALCRPYSYGTTARGNETVLCLNCREVCPRNRGNQ